jgi:hypothetical protein
MTNRRAAAVYFAVGALLLLPDVARADITGFLGTMLKPTTQAMLGAAVSASIGPVGFEIEYAKASEDLAGREPGVSTGIVSALVSTPTRKLQAYGALGVGVYRETLGLVKTTGTLMAIGGGVSIGLSGPLRVRLDYRLIGFKNPIRADAGSRHRVYAGAVLRF